MSPSPGDRTSQQADARDRDFGGLATGILKTVSDAFCVVDGDGRIVHVNRSAAEMLSAARESVRGHVLWERFSRRRHRCPAAYPASIGAI